MKYTDLSPEEFESNVLEVIADRLICLAHGNSNFVCSDCLRTMRCLSNVLQVLDSDFAKPVLEGVNEIIGGDY